MKHLTSALLAAAFGAALALPVAAQPAPRSMPPQIQAPQPQMQGQRVPQPAPAAQRAPQPQPAPAAQRAPQPYPAPAVQRAPQPRQAHAPHQWRTGERLPSDYRHRQYVVNDWRAHRLPQPPRGQHWVQVDGGYARIVIATGIIMQLIGV